MSDVPRIWPRPIDVVEAEYKKASADHANAYRDHGFPSKQLEAANIQTGKLSSELRAAKHAAKEREHE